MHWILVSGLAVAPLTMLEAQAQGRSTITTPNLSPRPVQRCADCGVVIAVTQKKPKGRPHWMGSIGEPGTSVEDEQKSARRIESAQEAAREPPREASKVTSIGAAKEVRREPPREEELAATRASNARKAPAEGPSGRDSRYSSGSKDRPKPIVVDGSVGDVDLQNNTRHRNYWEILIRMEDGSSRIVQQYYRPALQKGNRVKVLGNSVFVR